MNKKFLQSSKEMLSINNSEIINENMIEDNSWLYTDNGWESENDMIFYHSFVLNSMRLLLNGLNQECNVIDFGCGNGMLLKKLKMNSTL